MRFTQGLGYPSAYIYDRPPMVDGGVRGGGDPAEVTTRVLADNVFVVIDTPTKNPQRALGVRRCGSGWPVFKNDPIPTKNISAFSNTHAAWCTIMVLLPCA